MKKINIYLNGDYLCSTNQAKNCKEAKAEVEALRGKSLLVVPHGQIGIPEDAKITAFYDEKN